MKVIEIKGQTGHSRVTVNEPFNRMESYVGDRKAVIVTDRNVKELYEKHFPQWPVITIGTGEKNKTLRTVERIYEELVDIEADRSWFIAGFGGGIVCDIAGFVASTYMRGLPFGFVSTTLLSQVDASVGGKNGVNFYGYKNMVGVFNQPSFVICDTQMLKTLSKRELVCGFAEVVKHAAIGDPAFFRFLQEHYHDALELVPDVMERVVYDCITIKSSVVEKDEKEKGERRKLNFGHTFGHALEKTIGIPHGEAVGIGMVFAANLSVRRGMFPQEEAGQLTALIKAFHLPTSIEIDKEKIREAIKKDKKREGKGIHFVLLKSIGQTVIEEISIEELEEMIDDMC